MRLYEFKNADASIDVIVTTDGIGEQKNVFITATPTGPGYTTSGTIPEGDGTIQSLGFDFVNGTMREHQDFVNFAIKANLQLLQWNEGFGETTPIEVVELGGPFQYKLSAVSPIEFPKEGATKTLSITSTKQKLVDGVPTGDVLDADTTETLVGTSSTFQFNGTSVTAPANAGVTVLEGEIKVVQVGSGKTTSIILTQAGV